MTFEMLAAATRSIAANCDGAETRDGVGFNGTDSHFGKAIAALPDVAWTNGLARQAWEMLHKYKGQLAEAGFDYDAIPMPEGDATRDYAFVEMVDGLLAFRFPYNPSLIDTIKRSVPRARWNGGAKVWTAPPSPEALQAAQAAGFIVAEDAAAECSKPQEARPNGKVVLDGERIVLAFGYDPRLVAAVKELPGRTFDGGLKQWSVPLAAKAAVLAFAETHNFTVDPGVLAISEEAAAEAARPRVTMWGGEFALTFDYDRSLVEAVREVPGAQWNAYARLWSAPVAAAFEVAVWAERSNAIIDPECQPFFADVEKERALIAMSSADDADIEVEGLARDLMPFQRAAVRYALDRLGFLEAV